MYGVKHVYFSINKASVLGNSLAIIFVVVILLFFSLQPKQAQCLGLIYNNCNHRQQLFPTINKYNSYFVVDHFFWIVMHNESQLVMSTDLFTAKNIHTDTQK